jgi:hypothetical protein
MAIVYSICIPRVFKNITEARIRAIFTRLGFGTIERIDMVAKSNDYGDDFWRVFIHFSTWNNSSNDARRVKHQLESGEKVKIIYDDPWYWFIAKSSSRVPTKRATPYIDRTSRSETPVIDLTEMTTPFQFPTNLPRNMKIDIKNPTMKFDQAFVQIKNNKVTGFRVFYKKKGDSASLWHSFKNVAELVNTFTDYRYPTEFEYINTWFRITISIPIETDSGKKTVRMTGPEFIQMYGDIPKVWSDFTEEDQFNIDTHCGFTELGALEAEIDECSTHDVAITHLQNELDDLNCIHENDTLNL